MKAKIILILLLISLIASTGCIQISSQANSCSGGGGVIGVSYVEHTYLWGNDGFMTKKYDITVYVLGFPSVKTDISKYEFNTYKQTYCSAPTNQPASTTITTIRTPTPTPIPPPQHKITDGYWCRNNMEDVNGRSQNVKECYEFFADGRYKQGNSAGFPMVRPYKSCGGQRPNDNCGYFTWQVNSKGEYEIGMDTFTFDGYNLRSDLLSSSYSWSSTGL